MPAVEGIAQQTPEWLQMRVGMVTASRMAAVMAKLKDPKKESAERRTYKKEIVYECLTGRAVEHHVTQAMEAGIDNEPLARAAYEFQTGAEVEDGGFFIHDSISRLGASPDGLVGDDGLIEIKCPTSSTHIDTLISGEIPEEYQYQMLTELACTGRQWADFVSFDPKFPKAMRLFIKRFPRNDAMISAIELETVQFLEEVIALIKKLEGQ